MADFDWPFRTPCRLEMRIQPNQVTFIGPYTPAVQVNELFGERFIASVNMPGGKNDVLGAQYEAFFDRLKGAQNRIKLWNWKRPLPGGTLRGGVPAQWKTNPGGANATWHTNPAGLPAVWTAGKPRVRDDANQFAGSVVIRTLPGYTLWAGDHIGIDGQMVRVMVDTLANVNGDMTVEFLPRLRKAVFQYAPITWDRPIAYFILKGDTVPIPWIPGGFEPFSFDVIEDF